jgi:hypothetical protein
MPAIMLFLSAKALLDNKVSAMSNDLIMIKNSVLK